jgi:hypothetical protein
MYFASRALIIMSDVRLVIQLRSMAGIEWVEARGATKNSVMHRRLQNKKIIKPKTSMVLSLRNPD